MLKPKTSAGAVKAQLYKRYQQLDKSNSLSTVYQTTFNSTVSYWVFDYTMAQDTKTKNGVVYSQAFMKMDDVAAANFQSIITVSADTVLGYLNPSPKQTLYFAFSNGAWVSVSQQPLVYDIAKYANISKYQTNRYYYVCSFDFMLRGDISGTTTQPIKGNIMPLTTLSIRYFDDSVDLQQDDFVVVDGQLYSVESPVTEVKYAPKKFLTYYATLNSVL